jgi:hypothetical protein
VIGHEGGNVLVVLNGLHLLAISIRKSEDRAGPGHPTEKRLWRAQPAEKSA